MGADNDDLERLAVLAARAARAAGTVLLGGTERARATAATKSSITDMVSEMDHAAEQTIIEVLLSERPDDGVLAEEGSARNGTSGVRWIVDPLDGTTNYLYGFPAWCVSIAGEVDGTVRVGVVHDAVHGETYQAIRHRGATRNEEPLKVVGAPDLATALVATGFGYGRDRRRVQGAALARVLGEVRDVRRAGAAALDLCWVASSRLDLYYEQGLAPWDYAAGSLIAAEAGAWVGDLDGGPPSTGITVAAAPHLAEEFCALLRVALEGYS